jgi:hypothetical protein
MHIKTLLIISFSVDVLKCRPLIGRQENAQEVHNLSQAESGMILQNHRRHPVCIFSVENAALGSLKRIIERVFKISK